MNVTAVVLLPLHNVWLAGWFTVGVGPTVTDAVIVGPGQLANEGVIVNMVVPSIVPAFINVPEISPIPEAAIPVNPAVLSLVQL